MTRMKLSKECIHIVLSVTNNEVKAWISAVCTGCGGTKCIQTKYTQASYKRNLYICNQHVGGPTNYWFFHMLWRYGVQYCTHEFRVLMKNMKTWMLYAFCCFFIAVVPIHRRTDLRYRYVLTDSYYSVAPWHIVDVINFLYHTPKWLVRMQNKWENYQPVCPDDIFGIFVSMWMHQQQ